MIADILQFHRPEQAEEESINEYMAELWRLFTHCNFGAFVDEALWDHFICGLQNEGIQKKMLMEADLTLAKAIELSVGMESAPKNARGGRTPWKLLPKH